MTIDTKEEASTLRKTKNFAVVIYIVICFVLFAFVPDAKLNQSIRFIICGVLSALFLLFYWYQYKMEYTYFYFSNSSNNLVFKFYSLRNLYGKPKTIEIAKTNFVKYDIVTDFLGKKEALVLYQKTPKGIAKYPPISLTLLTPKQKTELTQVLRTMSRK